jgi:DMSO/TMAO reductase YedYZ molybdopterin-dependent catalytic subunit
VVVSYCRVVADFAEPGQAFSQVELQQAFRNRGMPLEAMRYDVTPVGLHYLLVHFDIPSVDAADWRLAVTGNVEHELDLTFDDLMARPRVTLPVTLECAGNGRALMEPRAMTQPWLLEAIGTAEWTGTPLAGVLDDAGVNAGTADVVFTGADHGIQGDIEQDYQRSLSLADATRDEVLLVYEMNGRPLEPQHGFPLRLLVPGWYGMTSVKWLRSIELVTAPFEGYQQAEAYHFQLEEDDFGDAVTRIRVRALMIPPGFCDFPDRNRTVDAGHVVLHGRAWCGTAPVERVEVAVDGGWSDAKLEPAVGRWAWWGWSFEWDAEPGEHTLACRATDADGNTQPEDPEWNMQGMANNLVQELTVTVR